VRDVGAFFVYLLDQIEEFLVGVVIVQVSSVLVQKCGIDERNTRDQHE